MGRLTEMETFVRVVESGSFSAVARERQQTQSAISKQVAALEKRLGLRLISRSTRSLSLTEEGRAYYAKCQAVLEAVAEADASALEPQHGLVGSLRVAASISFGRLMIVPRLVHFLERHPRLNVDLHLSDGVIGLVEEGIDVAIRMVELRDSSLIARKIGVVRQVLVATAGYLERHGTPARPADLQQHNCLIHKVMNSTNEWTLEGTQGSQTVAVSGNLRSTTSESLYEAVLSGLGVSLGPIWMYGDALSKGQVQIVLPDFRPKTLPIYAVTPNAPSRSRKVQEFVDYLAGEFAADPMVDSRNDWSFHR